ncbi:MAG: NADH-quinone oxidoreductase subunit N [Akkermansiaceae bacterium]|nr:NADH-quinone oxidoreductase subunit N [Akkermansiaceae bacterium]MCF7731588.1 NADH-quinone oxidoreductase subunit N [Akkermansiaceae bacterium]
MPAYYLEALTVCLGLVLLLAEAFVPSQRKAWVGLAASVGLVIILGLTFMVIGPDAKPEAGWAKWPLWQFMEFDSLARFYKGFAVLCTLLVVLMAVDHRRILARYTAQPGLEAGTGEYYALPVFACAGMMWMASVRDLAVAFVALELVTITFYIMVAYLRRSVGSLEAGVKYLILGALSTGFLVYGIAWIYGTTGTMNLDAISGMLGDGRGAEIQRTPLLFGIALLLVGLGFKVGAVPMQIWIPDVYQGAPLPTTAFLSVGSKAAGFILLIRVLEPFLGSELTARPVLGLLLVLAAATLLFGNLAAIAQTNFKRLLAYSSIAHAGFLLLALAAGVHTVAGLNAAGVVSFYLATYLLMTLGVFFILSQVRVQRDGEEIRDFNGLGKTHPRLALALTVLLASLAGVPLTAGFIGKFLVFAIAVKAGLWWGVAIAIIAAGAGFYYYFKVIRAVWWTEPNEGAPPIMLPPISKGCIAVLTFAVLVLGFWPQPIMALLR